MSFERFKPSHLPVKGPRAVAKGLALFLLVAFSSGCVSNRKIVLFQDQQASSPDRSLVDHTYEQGQALPTLERGDVISVSIDHYQLTQTISPQQQGQSSDEAMFRAVQHPYLIGFTVSSSGEVDLPIIGKVKVGGLTVEAAQEAIRVVANDFYASPSVRVYMLNNTVTVLGEVNRPGRYPVYDERMNIMNGLAMAGDLTSLADRSRIRLVRTRDGKNHLFHLDLLDEKVLADSTFELQPNDVVIVDPLRRRKFSEGRDTQNVVNILALLVSLVTAYALLSK
jgi:polysaccharide export outer membrane protein